MTVGFQCASCGKWHDELPLDFGYAEPMYVAELDDNERSEFVTTLGDFRVLRRDGETHHFVRGVSELPIVGMNESFRYGVWASLGDESFELARAAYANDVAAGPFFGWVSNRIDGYVDTTNLKSQARPCSHAATDRVGAHRSSSCDRAARRHHTRSCSRDHAPRASRVRVVSISGLNVARIN